MTEDECKRTVERLAKLTWGSLTEADREEFARARYLLHLFHHRVELVDWPRHRKAWLERAKNMHTGERHRLSKRQPWILQHSRRPFRTAHRPRTVWQTVGKSRLNDR